MHNAQLMQYLTDMVGVDRVVAGKDFPQVLSVRRPVEFVESIPRVTRGECEMILCENPVRLLKVQRSLRAAAPSSMEIQFELSLFGNLYLAEDVRTLE